MSIILTFYVILLIALCNNKNRFVFIICTFNFTYALTMNRKLYLQCEILYFERVFKIIIEGLK